MSAAPAIERLCRHACTLTLRVPDNVDVDVYGNPLWAVTELQTVCELQQVVSREELGAAVQITSWRLFLPPDTSLAGWDALRVSDGPYSGFEFELEGDAWLVFNPRTGETHHVEATVRRTR